jgi:hypothetical protein
MTRTDGIEAIDIADARPMLERRRYRRRPPSEWAEIRALYRGGATAKALAERFGGAERTIYTHLRESGCLRKDQPVEACALDAHEVAEAVRAGRGCEAEAPVRALRADASLGDAARAAAETAILMLRDVQPGRAYAFARLAGTLERLARGAVGDGGGSGRDDGGMERGRRAALDFLRREARAPSSPLTPAKAGIQTADEG